MTLALLLAVLLIPQSAFADCTGLIALPCFDEQSAHADRYSTELSARYPGPQYDPMQDTPDLDFLGTIDQYIPDPSHRYDRGDAWTYYHTPHGTYTNLGRGWILGPDGLSVPY